MSILICGFMEGFYFAGELVIFIIDGIFVVFF